MSRFYVGLNCGEGRDYSALAVLEWIEGQWDTVDWEPRRFLRRVRHLDRVAPGTSCAELVTRVAAVMDAVAQAGRCELIVAGATFDEPLVEMLRRKALDCAIRPVVITEGHGQVEGEGYDQVARRDLLVELQMVIENRALKIADGMEWGSALLAEMSEMREARRPGTQESLALAVALAAWGAEKWQPQDMCGVQQI